MLNARIKHILDSIIDEAYADADEHVRRRYKGFRLEISSGEKKNASGDYAPATHLVRVYNPRLGPSHLAKCCLHEAAHHIDYIKNGRTGHQKPFYEEYAKLIYAALDLEILSPQDFDDVWSADGNKVRKIVEKWTPKHKEHDSGRSEMIRICNAFDIKDQLKAHGYRWNGVEQFWEKPIEDRNDELAFLKELGVPKIEDAPDKSPGYAIDGIGMYVDGMIYIGAKGRTGNAVYEDKDRLKAHGFYFDRQTKIWKKKARASALEKLIEDLNEEFPMIEFLVLDRR